MIRNKLKRFEVENPTTYKQMITYLQDHSLADTAQEYAAYFFCKPDTLLNNLKVWVKRYNLRGEYSSLPVVPAPAPLATEGEERNVDGLTVKEVEFLEKFRAGDLSFEEVQREFAYRVLKRVMADPRLLKSSDWLRSEVIKIQREELSMKKEQMERAWAMIFGGFKIPRYCPSCGHDLQPKVTSPSDDSMIIETQDSNDHDTKSMGASTVVPV